MQALKPFRWAVLELAPPEALSYDQELCKNSKRIPPVWKVPAL